MESKQPEWLDHMRKRKTISVAVAVVAAAFSLPLHVAAFNPGSQPASERLVQPIKMKKHGYLAAPFKSCGTFMYHKGGKCLDARNK